MRKTKKAFMAFGLVVLMTMPCKVLATVDTTSPNQPAATQQAQTIKGNVVDENGEPLRRIHR